VKFVATETGLTTNYFSFLSFVAVFGSGIRDKRPGSATLEKSSERKRVFISWADGGDKDKLDFA
jgi:hypothetical protein